MEDPAIGAPSHGLGVIGRYAIHGKLASGSMATVHFGRLLGPAGFSRPVAIKRLNPHLAKDPEFVAMFLDEARLAARILHPNVVATLDVVARGDELFLVMDYVRGESLSRLLRASRVQGIEVPLGVVASILAGTLHGLHAVHEATNEHGERLGIVHRAVAPQNVLVGVDGVPRVIDFGVAKAAARVPVARDGQMKGRLSYMAPEQLQNRGVDRRTDVFAAGVVLWEAITGRRLFDADDPDEVLRMIVADEIPPPSAVVPSVSRELDAIVLRALAREPRDRFSTAREFAIAIEQAIPLASPREVGEWVEQVAGDILLHREHQVSELESSSAPAQPAIFDDDSRPNFMKTLDDRTPVPAPAAAAAEWDEAPTGVFDPRRSAAAALLASRARELAAQKAPSGKPALPSRARPGPGPASRGSPSSRPGSPGPKGPRTLIGGVAVLPVQIFDDDNEKTIVRDQPSAPPPAMPAKGGAAQPSPTFDDEQETTTVYDSPDDVGNTAPRTVKVVGGAAPAAAVLQVPAAAQPEFDGRVTLPPRHQIPAIAKATVAQDGVATIIVQERKPPTVPPPQPVQIAQIQKHRDFWSSPVAFVGLIAVLVALAASLGLVLGRARNRTTIVATAPIAREEPLAVEKAVPAATAVAPPPTPVAPAPEATPAPPAKEVAAALPAKEVAAAPPAKEAATPPPAEPAPVAAADTPPKPSSKKRKATWTPPPKTASPAPPAATAESKAAAPAPAPAKPVYEDALDVNPYASK